MTRRQQIAKFVAKQAALAAYNTIMKAPTKKVAGNKVQQVPTIEEAAKVAGSAAYQAVLKIAQMSFPAPDASNVQGTARSLGYKNIANFMGGDEYVRDQAQGEVPAFLQAYQQYKVEQGASPDVAAQHVEVVKGILREAGLQA